MYLHRSGRLTNQQERCTPPAFERGSRFGDDALLLADPARLAGALMGEQLGASQMTRARRAFGAAPGMRPRLVIGFPPISLMSAVNPMGGAALIAMPTP